MNTYRLIQGDCLNVLPTLDDESIDLVVTDPPYGYNKFKTDTEEIFDVIKSSFQELKRILKKGSWAFVFSGTRTIDKMLESIDLKFQRVLWIYKQNDCTYPWRGWILNSEAILLFSNGKPRPLEKRIPYKPDCYVYTYGKTLFNNRIIGHSTIKPYEIVRDLVLRCPQDGLILDPFLGSGTTMFACQNTKRNCIGIEIESQYCDIIKNRCFGRTFLDHDITYSFEIVEY